ncbi:MAG: 50S ribosome-binding GTPase, partial [Acidobacteria bacterium]|nr:50S ribosome-binding GTPase [Acidobacteriota bacterium]
DYPFTTLTPQLGVVGSPGWGDPFVLADLPGLIAGAAAGAGLGTRFLRHAERCRVLVHLVELSALDEAGDAAEDLATVERELEAFDPELARRPRLVVGSKADAAVEERRRQLRAAAEERGLRYLEISSATRSGLDALQVEIRRLLAEARAAEEAAGGEGGDDEPLVGAES